MIALSTTAAVVIALLWARPGKSEKSPPRLTLTPAELPADGYSLATLKIETDGDDRPTISFATNPHTATVEQLTRTSGSWQAKLRAGVWPARTAVLVTMPHVSNGVVALTTKLVMSDSEGDGTPDFLRLNDARDRAAFRRWFAFLAEAQYFQELQRRPKEIDDCAALIRYAYRESLRGHSGDWATEAHLPLVPAFDSVARYQYPFTPLGSSLFRVREGAFRASDLDDGAFAQFADAQTIQRLNTHFVSRDLTHALPGDLLFFRQDGGAHPFHSMIYVGESAIARDNGRYVVYHTGPEGADPGEIRRLSVPELLRFPEPQWRPVAPNRNFLGIYRWNILGEDK
jgi:uncharacterized protein YfaT (DUF1175 family)